MSWTISNPSACPYSVVYRSGMVLGYTIPLGTTATIDTAARTMEVAPVVM